MKIGLKRGHVRLVPHDMDWHKEFERVSANLKTILPDKVFPFEHIGSTSIPNILAKPIIDLMAGVSCLKEAYSYRTLLEQSGYEHRENGDNLERVLFVLGSEECRTHHFSLVIRDSVQWRNALGFRDVLRSKPELAKRYSELKEVLASKYPDQRRLYTQAKEVFFQEVFDILATQNED